MPGYPVRIKMFSFFILFEGTKEKREVTIIDDSYVLSLSHVELKPLYCWFSFPTHVSLLMCTNSIHVYMLVNWSLSEPRLQRETRVMELSMLEHA